MATGSFIEIRKIPVIKWYQTDMDRLAAVSEEALYKFVKEAQQIRPDRTIVIAEMFPFDKACTVYLPRTLKCVDSTGPSQHELLHMCKLGSLHDSVSASALRIINNEVYLTRQDFYTSIKQSLEVLELKFNEAIFI